jgi:hypothetical protein
MTDSQVASASAPTADPLADKNYRIRQLFIVLDLDVYDDNGFLLTRGQTDRDKPIVIPEAEFPAGLVALLVAKTDLARGFVVRPDTPALVAPAPVTT